MITEVRKEKHKGDSSIARLKKQGENFEVLVDCEKAMEFKQGKGSSVEEALLVPEVFKDARKGDKHGELINYFDTDDIYKIASEIITKGEVQLTADYRNKIIEQKKNQLITELVKRSIDPTNNLPIPPQRIELGLKAISTKIDYDKPINELINEVVDKLTEVMPIKISNIKLKFVLKPEQAAKSFGLIKRYGEVIKQDYLPDGSAIILIEVPAGLKLELTNELNKLTQGTVMIEEVKQ